MMRPSENNACSRLSGVETAPREAENLLGDFSALLRQIGAPGLLDAAPLETELVQRISEFAALQIFLETYFTQILAPLELPAIAEACAHAHRSQVRELIDLDRRLTTEPRLAPFAAASQKIGRQHLQGLRPLRDERTVRRYLAAVESGDAAGWHTLVYGLTMAIYSFPLRQALLHYSRQTLLALACAAGDPGEMLEPILTQLPEAVERVIPSNEAALAGTVNLIKLG